MARLRTDARSGAAYVGCARVAGGRLKRSSGKQSENRVLENGPGDSDLEWQQLVRRGGPGVLAVAFGWRSLRVARPELHSGAERLEKQVGGGPRPPDGQSPLRLR